MGSRSSTLKQRLTVLVMVGLVIGLTAGLVAACSTSTTPTEPGLAIVERVVDGDTIVVDVNGTNESVRLIGIDTPETHKPNTPVQCYGPEASAYMAELLPKGTYVRLERDRETRDDFGRLLAYVTRIDDGLFVNLSLVREGFARTLRIEPNVTFAAEFADAVRDARTHELGLWGACAGFGVPA